MSAVGSSADNPLAEPFNATFKRETLQGRRAFIYGREARLTRFRWLHRYNTVRRHSRLGQEAPIVYENSTDQFQLRWPQPHHPPCPRPGVNGPSTHPSQAGADGSGHGCRPHWHGWRSPANATVNKDSSVAALIHARQIEYAKPLRRYLA